MRLEAFVRSCCSAADRESAHRPVSGCQAILGRVASAMSPQTLLRPLPQPGADVVVGYGHTTTWPLNSLISLTTGSSDALTRHARGTKELIVTPHDGWGVTVPSPPSTVALSGSAGRGQDGAVRPDRAAGSAVPVAGPGARTDYRPGELAPARLVVPADGRAAEVGHVGGERGSDNYTARVCRHHANAQRR